MAPYQLEHKHPVVIGRVASWWAPWNFWSPLSQLRWLLISIRLISTLYWDRWKVWATRNFSRRGNINAVTENAKERHRLSIWIEFPRMFDWNMVTADHVADIPDSLYCGHDKVGYSVPHFKRIILTLRDPKHVLTLHDLFRTMWLTVWAPCGSIHSLLTIKIVISSALATPSPPKTLTSWHNFVFHVVFIAESWFSCILSLLTKGSTLILVMVRTFWKYCTGESGYLNATVVENILTKLTVLRLLYRRFRKSTKFEGSTLALFFQGFHSEINQYIFVGFVSDKTQIFIVSNQ